MSESPRILVVDDNPGARYVLSRTLRDAGFTIEEAEDGEAALNRARSRPDLVLLDVKLPGLDGLEVCQAIRRDAAIADIPVLHLTAALGTSEYWAAALECGSDGFLSQPVEPIVLVATIRSILRTRAAEHALREADRRKNRFLATLAHELRNPLAPLRHGLEILARDARPESLAWACSMMGRQVDALTRLVDDLLDLARISSGTIRLRPQRLRAADVAAHAAETLRPLTEGRGQPVTLEGDPGVELVADQQRLTQALGNLLHNAAKFSPDGAPIALRWEALGDASVRFTVVDHGRGLLPAQLEDLFEPFTRGAPGEGGGPEQDQGLGLGLALVRQLIELHGGRVTARSAGPGQGATFELVLPAWGEASVPGPPAPGAAAREAPDAPAPPACRVLVVDDNVDAAESLALLLRMDGHDVNVAHDGIEAVEVAHRFRPQVVLLDIGLPSIDGYEAARRIRADLGDAARLVALTGFGQQSDRDHSRAAGFERHLTKPVSRRELNEVLAPKGQPRTAARREGTT